MRTERVTFLTTPDHKAALDAFASSRGKSVGNIVREATSQYMAQPDGEKDEYEEALELILPELEALLPKWNAQMDSMEASIASAREAIRKAIADVDGGA